MQMGFYFDQARCTGCFACVAACKDWHNITADSVSWRKVETIEKGRYPQPFMAFLATSCYHCASPACANFCPSEAETQLICTRRGSIPTYSRSLLRRLILLRAK